MTTGLEDWRLENTNGRNILFYKGKNYIPKDTKLRWDIVKTFHDHQTAGHPVKLGLITQYNNITGGQDSGPLSKTMCRDVGLVNNSRLTERWSMCLCTLQAHHLDLFQNICTYLATTLE